MHMIPEAKELIILHLMEHDFLNESRFARSFARGKFRIKKWGKQRIKRELKMRDISDYLINEALSEIAPEEYYETLSQLARKKYDQLKGKDLFQTRKALFDFLYRRGFESNLINEVLGDMLSKN